MRNRCCSAVGLLRCGYRIPRWYRTRQAVSRYDTTSSTSVAVLIVARNGDRRCIRRAQALPAADMITSLAYAQGCTWVTRIRAAYGCNLFTMTAYTGESAKGCCSPAFS